MSGKTNVERGTEYERFTQGVYQALVNADGIDNVQVKHNVQLKGNSGCEHQIDVYWEFRLAGQLYRTAIECKAFDKSVSVGRIRDFYGVLVDVPGLIGVFATLVGYQSGAKLFAEHYGIALKELRTPMDKDWEGRIKDIHLAFHLVMPNITEFNPRISPAYFARIPEGQRIEIKTNFLSNDPIVFDRSGNAVATYDDLRRSLPTSKVAAVGQHHFASFPEHTFKVGGELIDIDGFDLTYDVLVDIEETVLRGGEFAQAIIKDVASGELTFVDKQNRVKTPRPAPQG